MLPQADYAPILEFNSADDGGGIAAFGFFFEHLSAAVPFRIANNRADRGGGLFMVASEFRGTNFQCVGNNSTGDGGCMWASDSFIDWRLGYLSAIGGLTGRISLIANNN